MRVVYQAVPIVLPPLVLKLTCGFELMCCELCRGHYIEGTAYLDSLKSREKLDDSGTVSHHFFFGSSQ